MNVYEINNEKINSNIKEDEIALDNPNPLPQINSAIEKKITPEMKYNFIKKVETLCKNEHIQLLRMLKTCNISITENFNGSFINLSKITDSDFIKLDNYVSISYRNNIDNEERIKELERLTTEVNSHIDNNLNENDFNNSNTQNIQNNLDSNSESIHNIESNIQDEMKNKNLNEIKNNKNLNSLEKAIMRQNLANSSTDTTNEYKNFHLENYKNSQKYTGIRAKLIKTCKEINKSDSFISTTNDDKRKKKKEVIIKDDDNIEKI